MCVTLSVNTTKNITSAKEVNLCDQPAAKFCFSTPVNPETILLYSQKQPVKTHMLTPFMLSHKGDSSWFLLRNIKKNAAADTGSHLSNKA